MFHSQLKNSRSFILSVNFSFVTKERKLVEQKKGVLLSSEEEGTVNKKINTEDTHQEMIEWISVYTYVVRNVTSIWTVTNTMYRES